MRTGIRCLCFRITPAWAGKRYDFDFWHLISQDHPRVGGEKVRYPLLMMTGAGSPPRGRGKASDVAASDAENRITPAWAGKSRRQRSNGLHRRDHPRVGGEKCWTRDALRWCQGSPPRGRGKDVNNGLLDTMAGITPAWAGKRAMDALPSAPAGDHPRVGGEKAA